MPTVHIYICKGKAPPDIVARRCSRYAASVAAGFGVFACATMPASRIESPSSRPWITTAMVPGAALAAAVIYAVMRLAYPPPR